MSGLFDILVICAVVALLVVRQFSAQRVGDERRWWLLPAVLTLVALKNDGVLDPRHEAMSGAMLGAGLLVGLVTGAGWGWTARLWQEPDASVWSQGTKATFFVWAAGMGLRVSLAAVTLALGIHQGTAALLVSLAAMLLARSGVLVLRARELREQYGVAVGVAAGVMPPTPAQSMGKGRA
ncbi:DUF1453 domain-containing protein [Streptomyces sp. NBC_00178]|uniref:DUF1453 domain-containing protein n=1 Tax=Streptomyces sp. NBC_00178 TaxID=2975672 RepID=UPI002E2B99F7|nr:DUF1453 domain-containing protein [Streptomyces sp. NBC_00178]